MNDGAILPAILLTVVAFLFGSILFGSQQPQQSEVKPATQSVQSVVKKAQRSKISKESMSRNVIKKAFEDDGGWNK